jgi:hypothetical protein
MNIKVRVSTHLLGTSTLKTIVQGTTRGSLPHYFETALPLTLLMIWIVVAFQRFYLRDPQASMGRRLLWPVTLLVRMFGKKAPRSVKEPVEYSFAGFALRGDVIFFVLEHLIPDDLGICIPNP